MTLTDLATLSIEPDTGLVTEGCEGAAALLDAELSTLVGKPWQAALGVEATSPLARAIEAGAHAALPPTLIHKPSGSEIVVRGSVLPQEQDGRPSTLLIMQPVLDAAHLPLAGSGSEGDTVLVLGVDQLCYSEQWGPTDTTDLLMTIRRGLLQIVRGQDIVGLPRGAAIAVCLVQTSADRALDISRAILSHLSSLSLSRGASDARLCIGLAPVTRQHSALAAMLAANTAMLLAQSGSSAERIRLAGERDQALITAHIFNDGGVFCHNSDSPRHLDFLDQLTALQLNPRQADQYLSDVVTLALEQEGARALAICRRRHDESYEFAAGGAREQDHVMQVGEKELPTALRQARKRLDTRQLMQQDRLDYPQQGLTVFSLHVREEVIGCIALAWAESASLETRHKLFDAAAVHQLSTVLGELPQWQRSASAATAEAPVARPLERGIEGYVGDNMEGAVDQAIFLAGLDLPVAIIGPRGTGKMYVAQIIHQQGGASPDMLVAIDCREFRSRNEAIRRIARELAQAAGKTLVFKSPHLMNPEAQLKLARQIATRTLADVSPPRYLPDCKLVALFPENFDYLMRHGGLTQKLASAFAGYPIHVPPIRDRKQAVLRWAHKILEQECILRDRTIRGFTPDAEQAMLVHDWPGNISEIRQVINNALDHTDKEWITPVDLGLFEGISADGSTKAGEPRPFLAIADEDREEEESYTPSALEQLDVALGVAVNTLMAQALVKPLGTWLEDEVVLAACDRYRGELRKAADFLHTRARNITRWMPKILARDHERGASAVWQEPQRLVRAWIGESAQLPESPLVLAQTLLMSHVLEQCDTASVANRARIMGVSTPTYQKRLQDAQRQRSAGNDHA